MRIVKLIFYFYVISSNNLICQVRGDFSYVFDKLNGNPTRMVAYEAKINEPIEFSIELLRKKFDFFKSREITFNTDGNYKTIEFCKLDQNPRSKKYFQEFKYDNFGYLVEYIQSQNDTILNQYNFSYEQDKDGKFIKVNRLGKDYLSSRYKEIEVLNDLIINIIYCPGAHDFYECERYVLDSLGNLLYFEKSAFSSEYWYDTNGNLKTEIRCRSKDPIEGGYISYNYKKDVHVQTLFHKLDGENTKDGIEFWKGKCIGKHKIETENVGEFKLQKTTSISKKRKENSEIWTIFDKENNIILNYIVGNDWLTYNEISYR